tara:strand:+ start:11903 stop:12652 length:750 start_codon:yes stop_codon:yes gene_type:complete
MKKSLLKSRAIEIIYHEGNERWCAPKGTKQWKPSVTTFLGATLNKGIGYDTWLGNALSYKDACKERDMAARRGTIVHDLCEKLIKEGNISIPEELNKEFGEAISKRMMSFELWYRQHCPEIITTEYKLYHPSLPFSGTPDIVCKINDKMTLIDIKTGNPYPTHQLQLTCYKMLWDAVFPEHPIQEMYGLYLKDSWISKVEPQYKKYKYAPEVVNNVHAVWEWIAGGKPWPKSKYPVKLSFSIKENEENL